MVKCPRRPASLLQANADVRSRATLVLPFSIALLLWEPVYSGMFYLLGLPHAALYIGLASICIATSPVVLHKTKSISATGNLVAGPCV